MKIPSNNQWVQTNNGDIIGVLHDSENVSLDAEGKVRLARKAFAYHTSESDANLSTPVGLVYYNNEYVLVTTDEAFTFNTSGGTLTQISGSPNFVINSDVVVCFDRMYVTIDDNVSYWNGSSWTNTVEILTGSVPHPMAVFDSRTDHKLAIGDGNTVTCLDSAGDADTDLALPEQYEVTTLAYRNGYLYVGTRHKYGGEAKIFIWDGSTANANYEVPTGASWVFCLTEYKTTVAAMLSTGQLVIVNGTATQEIAALPVYYKADALWQGSGGFTLNGKVRHHGMTPVGDRIYINLDGQVDHGDVPEMKSGIHVYDPTKGLYHRANITYDTVVTDAGLSLASSVITTSAAHNLKDGDAVQFSALSGLSGVDTGVEYYVSVQSTTTIKLAKSRKALANSNFVEITGTPGVGDKLIYVPNTDWATSYNSFGQGTILATTYKENIFDMWRSPVIFAGRVNDVDGTTRYLVGGLGSSWNIGRFSTQRIYARNIREVWQKLTAFVDGVIGSNEKVIVKYKTDAQGYPTDVLQGVWTSATTINSNSTTNDEDEWNDIEIGDEVTIVDGYGRGYSTHIDDIERSTSVTTLTVDESIGTANQPVYIRVDSFKKLQSFTSTREIDQILSTEMSVKSPWIQFKIELRGFETEIAPLDIESGQDK